MTQMTIFKHPAIFLYTVESAAAKDFIKPVKTQWKSLKTNEHTAVLVKK